MKVRRIRRFIFPLEKAEYLLNYTADAGIGGDKKRFWQGVMGFRTPEELRAKFLAEISLEMLQLQGQNVYGERYQAIVVMTGPSGVSWNIRTGWIVLFGEDAARFVTAFPERFGRQA